MGEDTLVRQMLKQEISLVKVETTSTDPDYGYGVETRTTYAIMGLLETFTDEDLKFFPPGTRTVGNGRVYLLPSYEIGGVVIEPKPQDLIVDVKGTVWRIDRIDIESTLLGRDIVMEAQLSRWKKKG